MSKEHINLTAHINKLPVPINKFVISAGELASKRQHHLYLVGGIVRDMLLGKANMDVDMVLDGDAAELARILSDSFPCKIKFSQFNTAKLTFKDWEADIASARTETYSRPGALPNTKAGTLSDDLFRRDFTINAMAVSLSPSSFGELIDRFHGQEDIHDKLIRILHNTSFIDDATRICRAIRYEQRFNFKIEKHTLALLHENVEMLGTISSDRIRRELELALEESFPEKIFLRASELAVLTNIYPALLMDDWLIEKFKLVHKNNFASPQALYLSLLTFRLSESQLQEFILKLKINKAVSKILMDSISLKSRKDELSKQLKPGQIYKILEPYSGTAILANLIAGDRLSVKNNLSLYLDELRYVKPFLKGEDLIKLGVPQGERIKIILRKLLEAKLDGLIKTVEDEKALVASLL